MKTINFEDIEKFQIAEIINYFETFNRAEAVIINEHEKEEVMLIENITAKDYKKYFMS